MAVRKSHSELSGELIPRSNSNSLRESLTLGRKEGSKLMCIDGDANEILLVLGSASPLSVSSYSPLFEGEAKRGFNLMCQS